MCNTGNTPSFSSLDPSPHSPHPEPDPRNWHQSRLAAVQVARQDFAGRAPQKFHVSSKMCFRGRWGWSVKSILAAVSRVNKFLKHTRRIKFFGPSPPARAQRCGMVTGWLAEQVSCLTGTTQRFFFSIGFWTLKAISAWLLGQLVAYSSLIFFLVHASMSCLVLMGLIFRWNAWDAENFIFVLPDKLSQKQVPQPALD